MRECHLTAFCPVRLVCQIIQPTLTDRASCRTQAFRLVTNYWVYFIVTRKSYRFSASFSECVKLFGYLLRYAYIRLKIQYAIACIANVKRRIKNICGKNRIIINYVYIAATLL